MVDALQIPLLFEQHPDPIWIYDRATPARGQPGR
jgi:hypothetical protein